MKRFAPVGLLLILALSFTSANAQDSFNQKYGTADDYHQLRYLNVQYIQSWLKSDTATYRKVLWADDFVQQNSTDGKLIPKKNLLPRFGTPRFDKIDYFYADKVRVQFITNNAALIFAETPGKAKGDANSSLSQYNDIYIRRNGRWQCVSANISIVSTSTEPILISAAPVPVELISYHRGTTEDQREVTRLAQILIDGLTKSNTESLKNILAEDFILLGDDGLLRDRKQVLEQQESEKKDLNYQIINQVVRFVAEDVAMVQGATITTHQSGKSGTQYNHVFVKRNNGWQCVSGNLTPIRN